MWAGISDVNTVGSPRVPVSGQERHQLATSSVSVCSPQLPEVVALREEGLEVAPSTGSFWENDYYFECLDVVNEL